MKYLIDSHCHIHDKETFKFALERQKKQMMADFTPEKIFARMAKRNVRRAICIGTTDEDSLSAKHFASQYEDIFWTYGVHPEEADSHRQPVAMQILGDEKLVAIGEVGLDYHRSNYDRDGQIRLFEEMIDLAIRRDLPMVFHVREAFDDFFGVLANFQEVRGVVHSFSDSQANLEKSLSRGFYIGVNGLTTFSNVPLPPLERMLLETDAPFLTPAPYRGQVNDPSHIRDIAEWVAQKYHVTLEEVAKVTTDNVCNMF